MPLMYVNCGSTHQGTSSSELSSSAVMKPLFEETFYPFLQTNCNSCHVRNGSGNGRFASSSLEEAYQDFSYMGVIKIADYAVSDSHNYPFSGAHHEQSINEILNQWKEGLADNNIEEDSHIFDVEPHFILNSKLLGFSEDIGSRTILWNLAENFTSKSSENTLTPEEMSKVMISSQVSMVNNVTGQIGYAISAPEVHVDASSPTDFMITGAVYNLNGKLIEKNTFYSLRKCIRKGESGKISNSGSIFHERKYIESDRIGVALLSLEKTTCPDPESLPTLSFSYAGTVDGAIEVEEGNIGRPAEYVNKPYPSVKVKVQLDQAPKSTVYVSVVVSENTKTNVVQRCCMTLADVDEPVRRGDWDFDFDRADLVFYPPGPNEDPVLEQTITVLIADDERPEDDETVILSLVSVTDANLDDSKKTIKIKILDESSSKPDRHYMKDSGGDYILDGKGNKIQQLGFYDVNRDEYGNEIFVDEQGRPFEEAVQWIPTSSAVTYSQLYDTIFNSSQANKRCIQCHNSSFQAGGYDVTDYKQMLQSGIVVPAKRDQSDFIRRIVDFKLLQLNPMPLDSGGGQSGTKPEWHDLLEKWVQQGARNN